MYVPRAMYSLRMSFWIVPRDLAPRDAVLLGDRDVEAEEDRRGRVDGHRRRDFVERDAPEEHAHVLDRVDRDAHASDLAARELVVRVAPHLRRKIEGDAEPRLPLLEQIAVALVRLLRRSEPRVLPHRPEAPPVHVRLDAARERRLAGKPNVALEVDAFGILGPIERRRVRLSGEKPSPFSSSALRLERSEDVLLPLRARLLWVAHAQRFTSKAPPRRPTSPASLTSCAARGRARSPRPSRAAPSASSRAPCRRGRRRGGRALGACRRGRR